MPAVPQANYRLFNVDAFVWLAEAEANSIHAVVTDPPFGLIEYSEKELAKLRNGHGGVWRIPPAYDGHKRRPVPRFTVLREREKADLRLFFGRLAGLLFRVLVPGAHVFIATNPLVSDLVYEPFIAAGFEKRGKIIRTVYTLRGGDRPAGPGQPDEVENRRFAADLADESPKDLIESSPARGREREIAPHPTLKPQHFMRQIVRSALPLGEGVILDPFMGSGATIAAAAACGLESIGLEIDPEHYALAQRAIPLLSHLRVNGEPV